VNSIAFKGDMYFKGEGVRKDIFKAKEIYQKAADLGHAES